MKEKIKIKKKKTLAFICQIIAGLKKKDEEASTMTIKFEATGFDVNMPPPAEGDE